MKTKGLRRIRTLHPEGKSGVNILEEKYSTIRKGILLSLRHGHEPTFTEIVSNVEERMGKEFDGSIPWYVEVVKNDLQARKSILGIGNRPRRYRLNANGKSQSKK